MGCRAQRRISAVLIAARDIHKRIRVELHVLSWAQGLQRAQQRQRPIWLLFQCKNKQNFSQAKWDRFTPLYSGHLSTHANHPLHGLLVSALRGDERVVWRGLPGAMAHAQGSLPVLLW